MRTPGLYSDIKVATQRNQLPNQAHKIIFINTDVPKEIPPTDIFDTVEADAKTAKSQSNAGRMMAAALMVSQGIDVEMATWTRHREDIKCDYKETFSMPFNTDGTATANLYYNHKSHLQTASMTIRQDSASTSYEFLGGAVPGDKEDIVGCSLLAGRVRDGMAEFTIYGFSKDAHFDDGKFDAVEVLLELRPLLTREMVRIDEKFEFVDVIPASSAGMANSEGDVYPHLTEPLVNSCCELVIIDGGGDGGGGDGSGTGGDGSGTGGSGGNTEPNITHSFIIKGEPHSTNHSLESALAEMENIAKDGWLELAMRNFLFQKNPDEFIDLKLSLTGVVYASFGVASNHFSGLIGEIKHERLILGSERTPEVMYSPKRWNKFGEYYEVDKWVIDVALEIRVTHTYLPDGKYYDFTTSNLAVSIITLIEKGVPN